MHIGLKEGRVYDITSSMENKRDNLSDEYIEIELKDVIIGDTWDYINGCSLKDSIGRLVLPLKEEELEAKINLLEARIKKLEEVKQ